MDFRILGPLEVLDKGEALDLGGPKQRALLACLLHANEVVPTDRLIDALWEEEPPETAHEIARLPLVRRPPKRTTGRATA